MNMNTRREFLKQTTGALLAGLGTRVAADRPSARSTNPTSVSRRETPTAIAMWDFSWLLRHYPTGEFEHWNAVLDGLVKRGYNAIRLDVFPALVAPDADGRINEAHHFRNRTGNP